MLGLRRIGVHTFLGSGMDCRSSHFLGSGMAVPSQVRLRYGVAPSGTKLSLRLTACDSLSTEAQQCTCVWYRHAAASRCEHDIYVTALRQ